jgi:hypothetical protein
MNRVSGIVMNRLVYQQELVTSCHVRLLYSWASWNERRCEIVGCALCTRMPFHVWFHACLQQLNVHNAWDGVCRLGVGVCVCHAFESSLRLCWVRMGQFTMCLLINTHTHTHTPCPCIFLESNQVIEHNPCLSLSGSRAVENAPTDAFYPVWYYSVHGPFFPDKEMRWDGPATACRSRLELKLPGQCTARTKAMMHGGWPRDEWVYLTRQQLNFPKRIGRTVLYFFWKFNIHHP